MNKHEEFDHYLNWIDKNAGKQGKAGKVTVGTKVEMKAMDWLWLEWIALGKLQIIAGRPGCLKTTIAMSLAAIVSTGGLWPDGSRAPRGKVLVWSGEDAIDDTLMPRFVAAGGDPANVAFVTGVEEDGQERRFDPAQDIETLEAICAELGDVKLIIIDPIVATSKGDSHKNAETRRDLQPLVDLAEKTRAAIIGIHHLTKRSEEADPLDRVSGSLAYGAAPRVVMLSAIDKKILTEPTGVFMRAKANNSPSHGGFAFTGEQRALDSLPDICAQRILWGDYRNECASQILAGLESKQDKGDDDGANTKAAQFLIDALRDGPQLAAEVIAKGEAIGLTERTLQRTLKKFGGSTEKNGFRGASIWEFPPHVLRRLGVDIADNLQ
jgi:hypothetical protein